MRSPTFLLADIILVCAGLLVVYRMRARTRYYRAAVTIYAMLLGNLFGAVRALLFLHAGL